MTRAAAAGSAPVLVVSVHDVAPATTAASRTWVDALDDRGIPASLLVVPGPWRRPLLGRDSALVGWLRERSAAGHEVVQHGWEHTGGAGGPRWRRAVSAVAARGCGEFAALDEDAAAWRLRQGRRALAAVGLRAEGFTPPGWLSSPGTLAALTALGFRYTTTHTAVIDLVGGRRHRVVALSNRPGGWTERAGVAALTTLAPRLAARHGAVRIALHPDDLDRGLARPTLRAIDAVLDAGAVAVTYGDFVADRAPRPVAMAGG